MPTQFFRTKSYVPPSIGTPYPVTKDRQSKTPHSPAQKHEMVAKKRNQTMIPPLTYTSADIGLKPQPTTFPSNRCAVHTVVPQQTSNLKMSVASCLDPPAPTTQDVDKTAPPHYNAADKWRVIQPTVTDTTMATMRRHSQ